MHKLSSAEDAAPVVRLVDVPAARLPNHADQAAPAPYYGREDLDVAVSHFLKRVAAGLQVETKAVLRPLNLTVSQYACLDMLEKQPEQTTAELARDALVTRQAISLVLRSLHRRGLITRPSARRGQMLPNKLTAAGREQLRDARAVVRRVDQWVLSPLARRQQERLRDDLVACAAAFSNLKIQD